MADCIVSDYPEIVEILKELFQDSYFLQEVFKCILSDLTQQKYINKYLTIEISREGLMINFLKSSFRTKFFEQYDCLLKVLKND